MPHDLQADDVLSRFLLHSHYINEEKGVLNTSVFTEKHPNGFSVYKTTGLLDASIWGIAYEHVIRTRPAPLYGRADLEVKHYESEDLRIEAHFPPPDHHNIFGMPVASDYALAEKVARRQAMVAKARLVRHHPIIVEPEALGQT